MRDHLTRYRAPNSSAGDAARNAMRDVVIDAVKDLKEYIENHQLKFDSGDMKDKIGSWEQAVKDNLNGPVQEKTLDDIPLLMDLCDVRLMWELAKNWNTMNINATAENIQHDMRRIIMKLLDLLKTKGLPKTKRHTMATAVKNIVDVTGRATDKVREVAEKAKAVAGKAARRANQVAVTPATIQANQVGDGDGGGGGGGETRREPIVAETARGSQREWLERAVANAAAADTALRV